MDLSEVASRAPGPGWFIETRQLLIAFGGGMALGIIAGGLAVNDIPVMPDIVGNIGRLGIVWATVGALMRGGLWLGRTVGGVDPDDAKRSLFRATTGLGLVGMVAASVILVLVGLVLTATIVGGIVGIPLIVLGLFGFALLLRTWHEARESDRSFMEHLEDEAF